MSGRPRPKTLRPPITSAQAQERAELLTRLKEALNDRGLTAQLVIQVEGENVLCGGADGHYFFVTEAGIILGAATPATTDALADRLATSAGSRSSDLAAPGPDAC